MASRQSTGAALDWQTQQLQQSRGFQSKKKRLRMYVSVLLKTHLPLEMMSGAHKASPCFTGYIPS